MVIAGDPHDDVARAIAVDVAGRGDRDAQLSTLLVTPDGPGGLGAKAGRGAPVDHSPSLVHLAAVVATCPHDDLGTAIAVDVAGRAHGEAEKGRPLTSRRRPGRYV